MIDMDRHIQQTNDRLNCIKQHLANPNRFQNAARELLDWCSDNRAFQKPFEESLIGCLTVVSRFAAQPGFDLDLGYRLLAVCATHRDKFDSKSASMLSVWCEELGRLLLLRHQKTRSPDAAASGKNGPPLPPNSATTPSSGGNSNNGPGGGRSTPTLTHNGPSSERSINNASTGNMQMQPGMQKPMGPVDPSMGWQQNQGPPAQGALSVVTTVWGLSQTTQSGPIIQNPAGPGFTQTTMSTAGTTPGYTQQQQGFHGTQMQQKPGYQQHPNMPQYNRQISQNPYNKTGYPPTPTTPGTSPAANNNGVGPPAEALNAAALVAAAATATATATATAVMGMQEQQRQPTPQMNMNVNMNMNNQYAPQQMGGDQYHRQQPYPNQQYPPHPGQPHPGQRLPGGPHHHMNMMNMQHHGGPSGPGQPMNNHQMGPGAMGNGAGMVPGGAMPPQHNMGMHPHPEAAAMGPGSNNMAMMGSNGPVPMSGKPGTMNNMVYQRHSRRTGPYPNPNQYMGNKQQMQQHQYNQSQQAGYPQNPYGQPGSQYPNKSSYMQQPMASPTYAGPAGAPQRLNMQHSYNGQMPNQYMNPGMGPGYGPRAMPNNPPYGHPQFNPQPNHPQQGYHPNMYNQHSPIPGNPTPPITPGSNPYLSPTGAGPGGPDVKPHLPDIKPNPAMLPRKDDELRLTFPVRDGVVLPPFRLEHNLAVSNHVFNLRETVVQTLRWRSDLELQLKCFHHEDRQMSTNWPASVTVSVNATPLVIERGDQKMMSHRPLYLKNVCMPGRNTIQITVTACCCSHLFVLQLVHRPSVKSVLQGLLRKRLLPAEHCIQKIKRNFSNIPSNPQNAMNGDDVEQTGIKVSLKCPITFRRITLPARGHDCKHIQCFDLESYLQLNCDKGVWKCPVCNKPAVLEGLEIDHFIWGILDSLQGTEFEEVNIDPTASWKPQPIKNNNNIKEEGGSTSCSDKWKERICPSSMTMPTISKWADSAYGGSNGIPSQGAPHRQLSNPGPGPQSHPSQAQGRSPGSYPVPSPYSYDSNGAGAGGGMPEFQSAATDFLSPLSAMSENLGSQSNLNKPVMSPMDAGQSSQPLRHPTPAPGTPGSAAPATPHTPQPPTSTLNSPIAHPGTPQQPTPQSSAAAPPTPTTVTPSLPSTNGTSSSSSMSGGTPTQPTSTANNIANPGSNSTNALPDLDFDPEAIIDGEGQGQEGLDLLPDNISDLELLNYLGPDTNANSSGNSNSGEDLLSFFDS